MKIAQIDLYDVELPYSGGVYLLSRGRTYESFDSAIVKITAEDGTVGWGESTPFGATYVAAHARGARAGVEELAPHLIGKDPRKVDRIAELMDDTLVGHNHAKAPLDIACWDLFGKSVGLPVSELLGGSTEIPMTSISSIFAGDPADMRARVADHRARGYKAHSVKIGALDSEGGPALDAARIAESLADRQPGEFFLVDANGGMTPETALRMFSLLPDGMDFVFEAPCATWRETLSLRQRSPYPIALDELIATDDDIIHAIATDAADSIGLKISPAGGLTPSRRQRDIAKAAGITMSVQDTTGSDIAFAAIVHLGSTVPPHLLRNISKCSDMVTLTTAKFEPRQVDCGYLPPLLPGLGIEVDESVLGAPVATWN